MRVAISEPSRHGAGVAATDDEHLELLLRVHLTEEVSKIGKSLLRVELGEIRKLPGIVGL